MIRHTRFAAPFLVALLAACAPRDEPPAPVVQHGLQSSTYASVETPKLAPHPSSLPPGVRMAAGGTTVVVRHGETLSAVARKSGTTVQALVAANNLKPPFGVQAGQKLTIPGSVAAPTPVVVASAKPAASEKLKPLAVKAAPIVPPADEPVSQATVTSSPRGSVQAVALAAPEPAKEAVAPAKAEIAKAEAFKAEPFKAEPLKVEPAKATKVVKVETLRAEPAPLVLAKADVPAAITPAAVTAEHILRLPFTPKPAADAAAAPAKVEPPAAVTEQHMLRMPSRAKPVVSAEAEPSPVPAASPAMPKPTVAEPPPRGGRHFLWPVKGKVLSGYGPQPGGLRNDGLNIAANRGEKVVAADNGVVVYAGDELKGFGNLVLIKHAGGFVTTYAHNDKLMVKRGDKVKRGQAIATVGESGAVGQPQVHFQVRQGAHAVDPRPLMERS